MIDSVDELREIAKEQGWTVVRTQQGHYRFMHPDGKQMVHIGPNGGHNRSIENSIAELRRKGLDIPRANGPQQAKEDQVAAPALDIDGRVLTVENALEAAVQMIEELADNFTQFRDETRQKLAAFDSAPDRVTPAMLLRESKRLEDLVADVGRKVDPISAFRARLRGDTPTEPVESAVPLTQHGCPHCARTFATYGGQAVHTASCSANPNRRPPSICPNCSREFDRPTSLGRHLQFCGTNR